MLSIYCNNVIKIEDPPLIQESNPEDEDTVISDDDDEKSNRRICKQTAVAESAMGYYMQVNVPKHTLPVLARYPIKTAQKWLYLPGKNGKMHRFPVQSILPKVQMMIHVPRRHLPKDVEIDRRRQLYAKMDIMEMLTNINIHNEDLLPTEEQYLLLSETAFKHFLPLSFFDSCEFSVYAPTTWLELGVVEEGRFPLPAKAFLPNGVSLIDYNWQYASVSNYRTDKGRTAGIWTVTSLVSEITFEVPRVQIMFLAENPQVFLDRIEDAVKSRNRAERLIMMETIVDCVLLQKLSTGRFHPNKGIDKLLTSFDNGNEVFMRELRNEVYLVFEHLMACYEFDKFVKMLPKEFPAYDADVLRDALPKKFVSVESIREQKLVKDFKINMKLTRYNVMKTTLYYTEGGIAAMQNVVIACQYLEPLFICLFAKMMPLHDFIQAQHMNSSKVAAYLKNQWPLQISSAVCLVLRALGKGWLDISLDKWQVYEMCKIIKFIMQTKLRMQDAVQELLQKSINSFTSFVTGPCLQFLDIPADYKWTSNYIITEFPVKKSIFSMVLNINEDEGSTYSTPPEDFAEHITDVFKKSLEKTGGIRRIEASTMFNLHFAPNLYILTVEFIEDLYIVSNDLIYRCYTKAVVPMHAYLKLYERFIPFYLLKVNDFMKEYAASGASSYQVKMDILEHKRQKEELRSILPNEIVIGPFLVIVDPLKQYMIKKHIEIVKRLFEFYVQRMFDINEKLLERTNEIYEKIADRPQSIEHLLEIRDYALTVPDVVEQLKADIQIMWLEYEMLDGFFYNLSDAQFNMKWEVYAGPYNIMQRLSTLREEQKIDTEEFRRTHLSECIGFEERLESLNEEIQAFSLMFDPEKAIETSVEVKVTWRIIMDLQKDGNILKFRQELFELPEFSLEFLNSIISGFEPYRMLWSTCFDFIKLEEATTGNPVIGVDLEDVGHSIQEIRSSLTESVKIFYDKPEVQGVAFAFLQKLDAFVPMYNCIKWLKNEHWLYLHWQELAHHAGIEIKYSAAINFQYLMRKGIMEHLELVKEISDKAEFDADFLRKALEEEERLRQEAEQALLLRKALRKCRTDIL